MKILALDLGANIGWAEIGHAGLRRAGVETFTGDRKQRAGKTQKFLQRLMSSSPDAVVYERPFARGKHATRALWGLAGIIEACAENAGAACLDVLPAAIKKHAAGTGNADKEAMMAAASVIWKAAVENEHMADAICLLDYAEKNIEVTPNGSDSGTRQDEGATGGGGEGTEDDPAGEPVGGRDTGGDIPAPEFERGPAIVDDDCLACQ